MGTIVARRRQNGGTAYLARIRLKHSGRILHQETRTFETHKRAKDWIRDREAELARPGQIERMQRKDDTLAEAISRYLDETRRSFGRTKEHNLNALLAYPIAGKPCAQIAAPEIIDLMKDLSKGRKPQTVGNYIAHLSAVFTVAKPAWGYPLDPQAMSDAAIVGKRLGLIATGAERDRRPTLAEIRALMNHFRRGHDQTPRSAPMHKIIRFAMYSTRRQEEITRLQWSDLDGARILVRDMKSPGQKIGNHAWLDLPPEALAVIETMPRVEDQIFPFGGQAISRAFTRACRLLGIEDLHFHDLRHDGISRLFEMGWTIPHVSAVSGHRSWVSLKRYTHIRQTGDKYAGFDW